MSGTYRVKFGLAAWHLYADNEPSSLGQSIDRNEVVKWGYEMAAARGYGMKRKPVVEVYDREGRLEMKLTPKDNAA